MISGDELKYRNGLADFLGLGIALPYPFSPRFQSGAFALTVPARDIASLAAITAKSRRRKLIRDLDAILATNSDCPLARELLGQIRRARDQLLTFYDFPGLVDATNNVSERALRPSVIQRKITNGYRAKWAADAEAELRKTVDAARLSGASPYNTILGAVSAR